MLNWKVHFPRKKKDPVCSVETKTFTASIHHRKISIFSYERSWRGSRNLYLLTIKVPGQEDIVEEFYSVKRAQEDAGYYILQALSKRVKDIPHEIQKLEVHKKLLDECIQMLETALNPKG